jgi:hypothetical protein
VIHLAYHPAFDAFHCIFRILRIREKSHISEIEVEKLRILDYYLLFPWRASTIKLARDDLALRRVAKKLEEKQDYATLPEGKALLERMKPAQLAAIQTMAEDGIIDSEALRWNAVRFIPMPAPKKLLGRVKERNAKEVEAMKIIEVLKSYPLLGPDGLKSRTSLLEHRYDKV